ncbi:MAG TPA: GatB/YqeY domain-containing protein [Longimicrobiaceae bacterium]
MAGTLKDTIRDDLNAARRDRDKLRTTLLTTLLSEIRNKEIEVGHELADGDVVGVANSAIKRRREAAEQMRAGGREELAAKEEQEAALLQGYLPPALGEDEVRAMVREAIAAGAKDIGGVMKAVSPRTRGQFDGRELNRIAREELAG